MTMNNTDTSVTEHLELSPAPASMLAAIPSLWSTLAQVRQTNRKLRQHRSYTAKTHTAVAFGQAQD